MSSTYDLELIDRISLSSHVEQFQFKRPQAFEYRAGQYLKVTVPLTHDDGRGNVRFFTVSSAPTESHLAITTKMQDSEFKRSLYALQRGDRLHVRGPYGNFTLDDSMAGDAVFISGGLGITPFRSMIKDSVDRGYRRKLKLLGSYSSAEESPFLSELISIAKHNRHIAVIPFITTGSIPDIMHESGRIGKEKIEAHVENLTDSVYYITGPTEMVDSISSILASLDISPDSIRKEYFSGYTYE